MGLAVDRLFNFNGFFRELFTKTTMDTKTTYVYVVENAETWKVTYETILRPEAGNLHLNTFRPRLGSTTNLPAPDS